jgi:predicted DNA-binding transcriptional regulator AlpA
MTPQVKLNEPASYYQSQGRRLLSVPETARLLGISQKTLYNLISETNKTKKSKRRIPPFKKFGRRVLFDVRDVERFIDQL